MSAMASCTSSNAFHILAPLEQSTQKLAAILAGDARTGDFICLYGDVGAGKSVFRCLEAQTLASHGQSVTVRHWTACATGISLDTETQMLFVLKICIVSQLLQLCMPVQPSLHQSSSPR